MLTFPPSSLSRVIIKERFTLIQSGSLFFLLGTSIHRKMSIYRYKSFTALSHNISDHQLHLLSDLHRQ